MRGEPSKLTLRLSRRERMWNQGMLILGWFASSWHCLDSTERNRRTKEWGFRIKLAGSCGPGTLGVVDKKYFSVIISLGDLLGKSYAPSFQIRSLRRFRSAQSSRNDDRFLMIAR